MLTGYLHAVIPTEYRWAPVITKPFEPSEMKEALANMLGLPEDCHHRRISDPRSGTENR
jgi:hypothetical protein